MLIKRNTAFRLASMVAAMLFCMSLSAADYRSSDYIELRYSPFEIQVGGQTTTGSGFDIEVFHRFPMGLTVGTSMGFADYLDTGKTLTGISATAGWMWEKNPFTIRIGMGLGWNGEWVDGGSAHGLSASASLEFGTMMLKGVSLMVGCEAGWRNEFRSELAGHGVFDISLGLSIDVDRLLARS